ncbi:helix-turn-helix domain-containing protein [Brevibacillus brevis]|uniref:helix-turn-helix domain-containing protein n=1 Tax=Brevibacillus brevis TaxID=1393 RepID=UPI001902AF57
MSGKNFGGFLKEIRLSYGYKTQKQLADASGISQTTLSRIEAGTQRPQPETLRILAEHLRPYTYGELMERAGYFQGLPDEDRSFVVELFDESEQTDLDNHIFKTIESISLNNRFSDASIPFLMSELGPLFEAEGWNDIEYTPYQIKQLIRELDSNIEYKKIILDALIRVQKFSSSRNDIETVAAYHDGEDWTEEELAEIERFKEFLKMKRKQQE